MLTILMWVLIFFIQVVATVVGVTLVHKINNSRDMYTGKIDWSEVFKRG